jgi:hypothetical protein
MLLALFLYSLLCAMLLLIITEAFYAFQMRHPRCVECKLKYIIKIHNTVIHNFIIY